MSHDAPAHVDGGSAPREHAGSVRSVSVDGSPDPAPAKVSAGRPFPEQRALTLAVCLLLGACLVALTWHVSVAYDIWWQLANGRLIVEGGQLVRADSFTFTITGAPYLDKYWLFEILVYLIHSAWGWTGLTALRALLVLGCAGSLLWSVRKEPRWLLLLAAIPALVLIDLRVGLRAYWLSFMIWPIYLRLAHQAFGSGSGGWRSFAPLWLAQVIWTNLHGELLWGPMICAVFAAETGVRAWVRDGSISTLLRGAGGVCGAIAACLVNPFGLALPVGLVKETLLVGVDTTSSEWLGFPTFAQPLGWIAWAAFLALVGSSFIRGRQDLLWSRLALVMLFAVLSLRSIRFLGNLVLLGLFVAMENQAEKSPAQREPATGLRWPRRLAHHLAIVLLIGLLWAICTDRFYRWQAELKRFGPGLLTSEMPVAASDFIRINHLEGNFLSLWSDADYLIWHNWPAIKVAEDGRTAPFPRQLSALLREVHRGDPEQLAAFEASYPVDGAVVAWHQLDLLRALSERDDWRLTFIGPYASVWVRQQSLVAQGAAGLLRVSPERFLVTDADAAFREESWLSYPALLHRRLLVFAAIGRHDLARTTALAWQAHDPNDPALLELAEPLGITPR